MTTEFFIGLLSLTFIKATPITLGALSGIYSERSGIINIAIDGIMLIAAFVSFVVSVATQNLWIGLLGGMLAGALTALLLAVLAIQYKVNQIIAGMVINLLAMGITNYASRVYLDTKNVAGIGVLPEWHIPALKDIPFIGPILFQHQPLVYIMLILVALTHYVMFYTPWGLRTRSVGEHPRAADTVGIPVNPMRYASTAIGGLLAGMAGSFLVVEAVGSFQKMMTTGRGFIALAVMIFGRWNPFGALIAALLFGFADALGVRLQLGDVNHIQALTHLTGLGLLLGGVIQMITNLIQKKGMRSVVIAGIVALVGMVAAVLGRVLTFPSTEIPFQFLGILPFVLTILVLTGMVRGAIAPAAEGVVYEKQ
jgi:simple sugar transport system permease protein